MKTLITLFITFSLFFASFVQANDEFSDAVQVGDLIQVNVPGESSLNTGFQVDKRGRITLPEVGTVFVAGYDTEQLNKVVLEALSTAYKDLSNASVYVKEQQIIIYVQGYVEQPGEYTLALGSSIQMALYAAGGLRPGAQLDKLILKRGADKKEFNYKRFLDSGDEANLPPLQSLDSLFVPASPLVGNIEQEFDAAKLANSGDSADSRNAIKVFGEVNAPGSFTYKENTDLVDVLMRSGGVTRYASVEQIRVISNNTPTLFNLKRYLDSGDESLLPALQPGSTIFVPKQEEEIKSGANMVYVMGEVAAPGAFEGKRDATFMDILANAGGPTRFAESRQIRVIKADGRVLKFDLAAYTEGLPNSNPPSIKAGDVIFVPEKTDMNEKSWLKITPDRAVNVIGEVNRPGRIEWSDEMNFMGLLAHVGGPTLRADTSKIEVVTGRKLVVFNLDDFIRNGAPRNQMPQIRAGSIVRVHDLPQDPSDNKSQWVRQSSDASIYIFGQVNAPGRYVFNDNMTILDILDILAEAAGPGPTDNAYVEKITIVNMSCCQGQARTFDLVEFSKTANIYNLTVLRAGDTIYIPDRRESFIEKARVGLDDILRITTTIVLIGAL
ncbi:SLBB domain-containing protein [Vibrio sp. ED004]|uniref:SLBB domain-containing protein n=1 Tax=unclassified Vibrio TaxID=2614977 RepID=UPI0002E4A511|nr:MULTISPECIES: SLBB domain-containing protein [unclassified Vibrio]UPR56676.1 SLBB domain-containing protein [Vibrio sp. ED004]